MVSFLFALRLVRVEFLDQGSEKGPYANDRNFLEVCWALAGTDVHGAHVGGPMCAETVRHTSRDPDGSQRWHYPARGVDRDGEDAGPGVAQLMTLMAVEAGVVAISVFEASNFDGMA
jgi:hypothetical protein